MGSIKKKSQTEETVTHELTLQEFNYVMNIQQAKQNNSNEYNRVISAFLKYICGSRLGYAADKDLQFELDFGSDKHELKVTEISIDNSPE